MSVDITDKTSIQEMLNLLVRVQKGYRFVDLYGENRWSIYTSYNEVFHLITTESDATLYDPSHIRLQTATQAWIEWAQGGWELKKKPFANQYEGLVTYREKSYSHIATCCAKALLGAFLKALYISAEFRVEDDESEIDYSAWIQIGGIRMSVTEASKDSITQLADQLQKARLFILDIDWDGKHLYEIRTSQDKFVLNLDPDFPDRCKNMRQLLLAVIDWIEEREWHWEVNSSEFVAGYQGMVVTGGTNRACFRSLASSPESALLEAFLEALKGS